MDRIVEIYESPGTRRYALTRCLVCSPIIAVRGTWVEQQTALSYCDCP
jgi:hypothetical protein